MSHCWAQPEPKSIKHCSETANVFYSLWEVHCKRFQLTSWATLNQHNSTLTTMQRKPTKKNDGGLKNKTKKVLLSLFSTSSVFAWWLQWEVVCVIVHGKLSLPLPTLFKVLTHREDESPSSPNNNVLVPHTRDTYKHAVFFFTCDHQLSFLLRVKQRF